MTAADASLAGVLFAIDPSGLGGVAVRAGPGPARTQWLEATSRRLAEGTPVGRIPARIEDDRLLGGLDAAASLLAGRPVVQRGVLARLDGGVAILAMAERLDAGQAGRIAAVLDRGAVVLERDGLAVTLDARLGVIAEDEGIGPDEAVAAVLAERLAFRVDLEGHSGRDLSAAFLAEADTACARTRLPTVAPADETIVAALCDLAMRLGIDSARAPIFALRAARAHAALHGRTVVEAEDAGEAARLVFAWRATAALEEAEPAPPESPEDAPPPPEPEDGATSGDAETLVEAIAARLPDDLLERLRSGAERRRAKPRARGGGDLARSPRRGRPTGSRPGELRGGARLHLADTLRAAAPWQRLRRQAADDADRVRVMPADFRVRRFAQRLESTTIFVVDASGSTAAQRLAEAKGAVELLLAKAYVSRAHVALVAFRGAGAEVLLPPTRSLARAKSRLAELPGGGGTPLAAGLTAALMVADGEKARDRTPLLVVLSDGRANIARDGTPGRAAAETDALAAAGALRAAGHAGVFVDTSQRPAPDGDRFAKAMGALYAPLPYVNAEAVAHLARQASA